MGGSVAKSSLKKLNTRVVSPSLQTEETVKDWTQSVQVGATDLIQSLEFHQLQHLELTIQYRYSGVFMYVKQVMNSVEHSLNACVTLVNSKRQVKGFLPITHDIIPTFLSCLFWLAHFCKLCKHNYNHVSW